jgi:hypothetical protein
MTPKRRSLLGDVLLVTWALITYYLLAHARFVPTEAYAAAVLLWLALSLWGLGRIAFVFLHAALKDRQRIHPPERQADLPVSGSWFLNPDHEDHHDDDHTDRRDEDRNDPARAPR